MKRLRPGIVPNVNFQYESSNETQTSYFFVFDVDQTAKNKTVKKSFVFKAFSVQEGRLLIDKNAIDIHAIYPFDFQKHYKTNGILTILF